MKIKGLLLAAAAGTMAATGAQAADLPGAPHPVDYVRICDTYGNGFYYIPGTDTCIRVFGRLRADYRLAYSSTGSTSNWGTPTNSTIRFRARAFVRFDTRTETEAGLLRTFIDVQFNGDGAGGTGNSEALLIDSAFIQYGGWTFGRTGTTMAAPFGATYQHSVVPLGLTFIRTNVLAYTFDAGNGVSATIALEDTARSNNSYNKRAAGTIAAASHTGAGGGTAIASTYIGNRVPELHANVRVSQSWGLLHLGGAVRQNGGSTSANTAAAGGAATHSGYDYSLAWAVNAGISGNIGGATVFLVGGYTSGYMAQVVAAMGAADYSVSGGQIRNNKAWAIATGINGSLGNNVSGGLEAYYGRVTSGVAGAAGNRAYGANANLVWRPVSGLQFGAEVNWMNSASTAAAATATNTFFFLFRAQRDY